MPRFGFAVRPRRLQVVALAALVIACSDSKSDEPAPASRQRDGTRAGSSGAMHADLDAGGRDAGPAARGRDAEPPDTAHGRDAAPPDAVAGRGADADDAGVEPSGKPTSEDPPSEHCHPTAGGPYSVLEQDLLTVELKCATGLAIPESLSIDGLPSGATYDKQNGTLSWTPGLDQAAVYELILHASPWNETGKLTIAVTDRYGAAGNVPPTNAATYSEEFGLPVIHLTTDPAITDEGYTPAQVTYRGHTFVGAEAKYRGVFSSDFPKRSYTLKFTKTDKFGDPNAAGGFNDKRKIVLSTPFDDNSYLRQRLSFELWNVLGPTQIKVQSYSAVLYLNGAYYGLYTVTDHVDGYLMEDHGLDQDGNLYKARSADANFREAGIDHPVKSDIHLGFTKEEGTPEEGEPDAYADLDEFLSWTNTVSAAAFTRELDARAQRSDYENWWILVSFIRADDSTGKNSYHYHDPNRTGSLWRCVPWDFNESWGQDYTTRRVTAQSKPDGWPFESNGLFQRLNEDPTFGPALRARYHELLTTRYNPSTILPRIAELEAAIRDSAHRDEQKWQSAYRSFSAWQSRTDFTTFDQEIQYLRQWITDRHAYLSAQYE